MRGLLSFSLSRPRQCYNSKALARPIKMKENWFIGCLFLVVIQCHYFKTTSGEMEETFLNFSDEGLITDETRIPNCGNGSRINLLKYNYQLRNCTEDQICLSSYTEPFLQDQELIIYHLCSFRERCLNMSHLNPIKNQKNRTNVMYISYQCLDHTSNLIDICKAENYINGTVHLIATDIANPYTDCQCFVTRSSFSLFLNDVRLRTSEESACSGTELKINNIYYSCGNNSGQFGSIFRERFGDMMPMAFISVTVSSLNAVPPQMIWLTIQSSGEADTTPIIVAAISATTVLLAAAITATIIVVVQRKKAKLSGETNARHEERPAASTETVIHANTAVATIHAQTPMECVFHRKATSDQRNLDVPTTSSLNDPTACDPDSDMYWEIREVEESNETHYEQLDLESEEKGACCTKTHSMKPITDKCHFPRKEATVALTVSNVKPRSSKIYEGNVSDEELEYFHQTSRHSNGYMRPIFVRSPNSSPIEMAAEFAVPRDSDYLQPIYNHQKDILYTDLQNELDTTLNHYYFIPISAEGKDMPCIAKAAELESAESSDYLQPSLEVPKR